MESSQGPPEAAAIPVPGISADDHSDTDSHVSFNADDLPDGICDEYAGAFTGQWSIEDEDKLQELGWEERSQVDRFWWKRFVPYWTHPNWDPAFDITIDGKKIRASRGDKMRAAILPADEGIARTNHTRRWGINTSVPNNRNGEARSGLTPNVGVAPMHLDATGPGTTEQWTQGFQAYWFGGYTAQELNDLGAYSQDLGIPASDLPDSDIHRLFRREKWTQEPPPEDGNNRRKAIFQNFDLSYNFGGGERKYDAKENDAVWNALLPSIKLASRIIRSNHPHWRMLLAGIYHMRKVPQEKDGRTSEEKQMPDYREYRSLWLNIDRNEMYPSARELYDLGFEAARATLGILISQGKLKWSIAEAVPNHNGLTMWEKATSGFSYRICLSVNFIWPLLVDQYTESEKAGYRVIIARIMLHELAHACNYAHTEMIQYPSLVLGGISRLRLTPEMRTHLIALGNESLGPRDNYNTIGQYFFQDEVFLEEGKAFDNQLWGSDLSLLPHKSDDPSAFAPILQTSDWPWSHPQVHLQSQKAVSCGLYTSFTGGAYNTYLLSPPAPVYSLRTLLPVTNYANLLQSSWWENHWSKYGPQALKITSAASLDMQTYPRQAKLASRYDNLKVLLIPLVKSKDVYVFLFETAPAILRAQRQYLLLHWLQSVTWRAAGYKVLKLRLHYERRTWPQNFKRIQDLCQNIARDSGRINTDVQNVISNASAVRVEEIVPRIIYLLRQDVVQLHRLLGYQVRYSQCLAAECLIGTADRPVLLGKSIGMLQQHLETTSQSTGTVLLRLEDIKKSVDMDPSSRFTEAAQDWEATYANILAEKNGLDKILQLFRGEAEAEEGSSTRGPLAFVPIVRRNIQEGVDLQRAALHEFLQISDPKLARIVRTWINILAINEDLRNETSQAIDEPVGRTVAEIRRARDEQTNLALAVQFLDRVEQLEANDARGLKRSLENDQLDTKLQDVLDNSGITDSTTYKQSFTQAEQTEIKRRRGG